MLNCLKNNRHLILQDTKIRVTLLSRNTKFRNILNEKEVSPERFFIFLLGQIIDLKLYYQLGIKKLFFLVTVT